MPTLSAYQLLEAEENLIGSDVQRFMLKATPASDNASVISMPQKILTLLSIPAKEEYDPGRWQTAREEPFIIDYSCEATVNKKNQPTGAVLLFQNVTQQRENEEKVEYLANFDELTGLANRTNFNGAVESAILRNARGNRFVAILIVDTDHLTVINERFGQEAGDRMLEHIPQRLRSNVRPVDMVARLHGDQFAVLLVDMDHAENAAIVADKMIKEAADPIDWGGDSPLTTSVSVGIAVTNAEEDRDAKELRAYRSGQLGSR